MVFVQHVESDIHAALQPGEALEQAVAVFAPDQEIELVAKETADPGGADQPVDIQQFLAGGGAGEDDKGFTFQKCPGEGDEIEPLVVALDQTVDVDVHGNP